MSKSLKTKREEHEKKVKELQDTLDATIIDIKRSASDEQAQNNYTKASSLLDSIEQEYKLFARDCTSILDPFKEEINEQLFKHEEILLGKIIISS